MSHRSSGSRNRMVFERGDLRSRQDARSTTGTDSTSDDPWDDRILTEAYDRALSVAQDHVAKRLAMNTNTLREAPFLNNRRRWKVGDECRAIYGEDGLEYEATIVRIRGDSCVVSYVGYENEEEVKLGALKPSLGKNKRHEQTLEAVSEAGSVDDENDNDSAIHFEEGDSRNNSKGYGYGFRSDGGRARGLPPLSPFIKFPHLDAGADSHIPLPPPPPFSFPNGAGDSFRDDRSLSAMLISWYMSGYYTGLYQGRKMRRQRYQNRDYAS